MTIEEAEKLSLLMTKINSLMNQSVAFVQEYDSDGVFEKYHQTAGKIMASLLLDIQEPIWKTFPELRPIQMDGTYEIALSTYEPVFFDPNSD